MSVFGPLLSAGIGLIPSLFGDRRGDAIRASQRAGGPLNVRGPFGSAIFSGGGLHGALDPRLAETMQLLASFGRGQARTARNVDIQALEAKELKRLRELARPEEQRLRAKVRNEQFQRGRLGLGVPGGRTGAFANPELAALAEAQATADLLRTGQAQDFARNEQQRMLQNALAASGFAANLGTLPTQMAQFGVNARMPVGLAGLDAQLGDARFRELSSFFAGLGPRLSRGLFSGGIPSVGLGGGRV